MAHNWRMPLVSHLVYPAKCLFQRLLVREEGLGVDTGQIVPV